jgi:hypothetical protein
MTSVEFDEQFPMYREWLRQEIHRFRDAVDVYRCINERTKDHLAELNLAPGFFRTTESALFTLIVMWADKLLDEHAERGLFNFLTFVEYNRKWLSPKQLQRRRGYPDDHWMLEDRKSITLKQINADREAIRALPCLQSFKIRRDKFHGHFDKEYFFDRKRLSAEAPLKWDDLEQAGDLMGRILNDYSVDFDGNAYSWSTLNIDDLSALLTAARRGIKATERE